MLEQAWNECSEKGCTEIQFEGRTFQVPFPKNWGTGRQPLVEIGGVGLPPFPEGEPHLCQPVICLNMRAWDFWVLFDPGAFWPGLDVSEIVRKTLLVSCPYGDSLQDLERYLSDIFEVVDL